MNVGSICAGEEAVSFCVLSRDGESVARVQLSGIGLPSNVALRASVYKIERQVVMVACELSGRWWAPMA